MSTSIIRARLDRHLKQEVETILAAIGLTTADAVRLLMVRIAHDKRLPFEPLDQGITRRDRRRVLPNLVTPQMRQHVECKTHDHFGFSGYRAAIACLYARPEGATQAEVNQAAWELGSNQSGYFNMLRQAQNKWKHSILFWDDPARDGKVYKLIFNPDHSALRSVDPPSNWKQTNVPNAPPRVKPLPYKTRSI